MTVFTSNDFALIRPSFLSICYIRDIKTLIDNEKQMADS